MAGRAGAAAGATTGTVAAGVPVAGDSARAVNGIPVDMTSAAVMAIDLIRINILLYQQTS
jgi:hypothetical protein